MINRNSATPEQIDIFDQAQRDIDAGLTVRITYQGSDKIHTIAYEVEDGDWLLHRIDRPAFYVWDLEGNLRELQWWKHDKMHRRDGPAWQEWDAKGNLILEEYWVNGKETAPHQAPSSLGRVFV